MANWMKVNVAEAPAFEHERAGTVVRFESAEDHFTQTGVNIRVLAPGQPNGMYHSESVQEDFLVLGGECIAILDGDEVALRAGDFVHCSPGTEHIFVGAGDGPCALLMIGARREGSTLHYPANNVAARYGASVNATTSNPGEAYADWSRVFEPTTMSWPPV